MANVPEGPFQKIGAVAGVIAVVVTAYFGFKSLGASSGAAARPATTSSATAIQTASTGPTTQPHKQSASATTFASPAPSPVRVPLADLCNAPNAEASYCGTSDEQTVQVGSTLFPYYAQDNPNGNAEPPNWDPVLQFPATTCTRLVLNFAPTSSFPNITAHLEVVQSHSQPKTASAPSSIGTLAVKLDGGPFQIQVNSTDGSPVAVNGYAICNSPSGE